MNEDKKAEDIMKYCKDIYGDCTDGSFQACLHYEGYYKLKKQNDLLNSLMNEFTKNEQLGATKWKQ